MKSHNNRNNNNKLENFQNEVSKFFEDKEFIEYFEIFQKITDDLTQKVKTKDFDEANRKEIQ